MITTAEVAEATDHEIFAALRYALPGSHTCRILRTELIGRHLPLVDYVARRFRGRGEPHDDLVQVGAIGLINAIDHYDAARGIAFTGYAVPCILGEIRRHFRDRTWAVHVPRRLQENALAVMRASSEIFAQEARAPTVKHLAAYVGLDEEEVLEALDVARAHNTIPLQESVSEETPGTDSIPASRKHSDQLASREASSAMERVEARAAIRALLADLNEQERQVIVMRFVAGMTQSQIGALLGISQMHVSRLLSRSLAQLRHQTLEI